MLDAVAFMEQSRFYGERERYDIAFAFILKAIEIDPRMKESVKNEFQSLLTRYNQYLTQTNANREVIYDNFLAAFTLYPGNTKLLCGIGQYLMRHLLYRDAICHIERSLLADSNLVEMEKGFDIAKNYLFSRNNFRFLNDAFRKRAYLLTLKSIEERENAALGDLIPGFNIAHFKLARTYERIRGRTLPQEILNPHNKHGILEISDLVAGETLFLMNRFGPALFKDRLLDVIIKTYDAKMLEGQQLVPGRAEYYIMGAKCDRIKSRLQVNPEARQLLGVPDQLIHVHYTGDAHHGMDIQTYRDLEFVTDSQELFKINFNNYDDVVEKNKADTKHKVSLKSNVDTEINVIIGWFNLRFTERVTLTTNPRTLYQTDAWPQAVFLDFVPTPMKANENLDVQFTIHEGQLKLVSDAPLTRVSDSMVAFLNDSVYIKAVMGCLGYATVHLTQEWTVSELEIVDLCPFPVFGMFMLKRGAASLLCYAPHAHDRDFIKLIFEKNDIPMSKVTILTTTEGNLFNKSYHCIMYNALELGGDMDQGLNNMVYHLQCSHLVNYGLSLPANVRLVGQLIRSDRLDTLNKVMEDGPMGPLAGHLNVFQASQAFHVDPFRLEHLMLSNPVVMSPSCLYMLPDYVTVPVEWDGVCNAILCWYEINMITEENTITTYRKDSFVNSTAFLLKCPVEMKRGDSVSLVLCVDYNGAFKLAIDWDVQ